MEIRKLKTKDIKTLAEMLAKLNPESVKSLFALVRSASGKRNKSSAMEIGFTIFQVLAADLTNDIFTWLADLAGMTPEEFGETDVSVSKEVVSQLVSQAGFADFLASATKQASTQNISTAQ